MIYISKFKLFVVASFLHFLDACNLLIQFCHPAVDLLVHFLKYSGLLLVELRILESKQLDLGLVCLVLGLVGLQLFRQVLHLLLLLLDKVTHLIIVVGFIELLGAIEVCRVIKSILRLDRARLRVLVAFGHLAEQLFDFSHFTLESLKV